VITYLEWGSAASSLIQELAAPVGKRALYTSHHGEQEVNTFFYGFVIFQKVSKRY